MSSIGSKNRLARRGTANLLLFVVALAIGYSAAALDVSLIACAPLIAALFLGAEVWIRRT
jgi:hypothetical protein